METGVSFFMDTMSKMINLEMAGGIAGDDLSEEPTENVRSDGASTGKSCPSCRKTKVFSGEQNTGEFRFLVFNPFNREMSECVRQSAIVMSQPSRFARMYKDQSMTEAVIYNGEHGNTAHRKMESFLQMRALGDTLIRLFTYSML